jgi:NitT/TauT family transport system permease protein
LKILKGAMGGTLFLFLWWFLVKSGRVNPLVLPSPDVMLSQFGKDFCSGELPLSLFYSLLIILSALLPSLLLAFFMAACSLRFPRVDRFCEALAALAHPLPGIALLPLFILWVGLGRQIIILTVIHSVLWPFYINIRAGFKQVSPLWIGCGKNRELSDGQIFRLILIPGAYPYILSGIKVGWARSWRALIAAEMLYGSIGGSGGLGWYIFNKRIFMDSAGMYGGIFLLMLIGFIVDRMVFTPLEKRIERVGVG